MKKKCKACEQLKSLTEYYFREGRPRASCKVCWKKHNKEYRKKNQAYWNARVRARRRANPKKERERKKREAQQRPWRKYLHNAHRRCTIPTHPSYSFYGGKGIKMLLTSADGRKLWNRDKAYLLDHPSIDRIDSNKDYIYTNCRFVEWRDNRGGRRK